MKKNPITYISYILLLLLTYGCGRAEYPPDSPTITPTDPLPQTSSGNGGFHVILVYGDDKKPVKNMTIYLAQMIPVKGMKDTFVPALDQVNDPKAESSNNGSVSISYVPPGKYALTLMTPTAPIMLTDMDQNKDIVVDITAGQVVDLGQRKVKIDPNWIGP